MADASRLPDDWIDLSIPEYSTDPAAEGYGPPIGLPEGSKTPENTAQTLPPEPIEQVLETPSQEPRLPVPIQGPGTPATPAPGERPNWKRDLGIVALQVGVLAATYYGFRAWERWWSRRKKRKS